MPARWQGCGKVHAGCGGICRWVEAIDTPGVGYTGECVSCGDTDLVVEEMIPVEGTEPNTLQKVPLDTRSELTWDDDADWDANQKRLAEQLPEVADD